MKFLIVLVLGLTGFFAQAKQAPDASNADTYLNPSVDNIAEGRRCTECDLAKANSDDRLTPQEQALRYVYTALYPNGKPKETGGEKASGAND